MIPLAYFSFRIIIVISIAFVIVAKQKKDTSKFRSFFAYKIVSKIYSTQKFSKFQNKKRVFLLFVFSIHFLTIFAIRMELLAIIRPELNIIDVVRFLD